VEHVAALVLHAAVEGVGGDDFRKVKIDALDVRVTSQNASQDGAFTAADVHELANRLEALVLGQQQRQHLVGVIRHGRLEDAQMLRVRVHVLEFVHPICQLKRVLTQQNRFTANTTMHTISRRVLGTKICGKIRR
jgi:hypothetical protein